MNTKLFTRSISQLTKQIYLHPSYKISFGKAENSLAIGSFATPDLTREAFVPNPQFLPKLNQLIGERVHEDFTFIMEASVNANSFMPIYDLRDVPRYGRIPEIDSVFGYLQVSDKGEMLKGTYQNNDMYQLYNSTGLIMLSDFLLEEVRKL
ncbi:hypothetical protein PSN45_002332 [Yamadazyma tenuis]|uniref:Uncharacterized protein n=1 Tax=Candida tenuis (strain ATCC 10573 / BCRC 21748 / CBS 615 / JCM 9827 / NBRC 10315 / NRRL Y-1498 / VKM Y-70) TaxID=590646 RepID=G3BEP4_CANTC|nr:uncharacterized protein CANTEDRAFT_115972 [Yamadazyma tenuis ATCC 10573]XP_006690170.1 uncharacterized protein CANTEDRAFT_115972 [Yamadazyma tenuis ATCC 10573]EGV60955.1 hypothetical protein CANTEDRAFT_115972 [Yamadazyma tenuis ATCC 10573]EGV60956.1 hypothetical protein CANTEDRAFT_115972 [Yamadazyma tenuis ATCC 10573]WEJ94832.1 hypothetical protein PSN45_002332 [Yamadazyma tenuis]